MFVHGFCEVRVDLGPEIGIAPASVGQAD